MEKVFAKNKNCFGDALIETLNYYMIFGRQRLLQDPGAIAMLVKLADQALFTLESSVTINNA